MQCKACGANIPEGVAFCGQCGASMAPSNPAGAPPLPSIPATDAAAAFCPACGAGVPERKPFCGQCGASMAPPGPAEAPPVLSILAEALQARCAACGAEVREGAAFCGRCGASLAPSIPAAEPAPLRCPACGAEVWEGVAFCGGCGAFLAPPGHLYPALAAARPPLAPTTAPAPGAPKPRRRRGCLRTGCLISGIPLLLVLAFLGWVVLVQTHTLERIGLRTPPEERLLGGRPDEEAAQALKAELLSAGFSDAGLQVVVLPVKDKDYNLAVVVMDASQGFRGGGSADLVLDCLQRMATGPAAGEHAIGRVAVHYKDSTGEKLISLTAATADIRAFASGQMDRTSFLKASDGNLDWKRLVGGTP